MISKCANHLLVKIELLPGFYYGTALSLRCRENLTKVVSALECGPSGAAALCSARLLRGCLSAVALFACPYLRARATAPWRVAGMPVPAHAPWRARAARAASPGPRITYHGGLAPSVRHGCDVCDSEPRYLQRSETRTPSMKPYVQHNKQDSQYTASAHCSTVTLRVSTTERAVQPLRDNHSPSSSPGLSTWDPRECMPWLLVLTEPWMQSLSSS